MSVDALAIRTYKSNYIGNAGPGGHESLLDERKIISDWLSPLDFSLTQNYIFRRRAEGTGQWLLESKEFEEWRDEIWGTLFCPGIPGAGKTIFTSIIINHLQRRFETENKIAIAYIYLDYKKQAQQSLSNLVSSLLKQLIQIRTCSLDDIKVFFQQHNDRNICPTLDALTRALKTEISKLSKVFIIVDAVDELTEDNGARANLLILLRALTENVNLLVTSRHIDSITVYFQDTRRLEICAHDEDVRKYIQGRIPRWYSMHLAETVTKEIVKKAEGMFLLARLHMDSFLVKHSPAKVIQALKTLPRGMDQTYDEAMKRIQQQDEEDRARAYRVLSWIVFAYRPLSVKELQCALAVSPGTIRLDLEEFVFEEYLTSYCAGLVIIDEGNQIIRLAHYTIQKYFEERREKLFPDTQTVITRTCLTYLMFDDFEKCLGTNFEEKCLFMTRHPLLKYAALYWGRHANGHVELSEKPLLLKFLRSHHVSLSSRILLGIEIPWRHSIPLPSLHLCAFFGLGHMIRHELDNGEEVNLRDSWGRTSLSWAIYKGHFEIVLLLLAQKGIDINANDNDGWTPLSFAAEGGHDEIVRRLLAQRAIDTNAKSKYGRTPLSYAAERGHDKVVRLLLAQEGIVIDAKHRYGRTPLSYASERGHDEIVRLLLKQEGIDINTKDDNGRTPLSFAAERGHDGIVHLLLMRKGIDIDVNDNVGRTPLSYTAERGHDEIVRLLLAQKGIDINTKNEDGSEEAEKYPWTISQDEVFKPEVVITWPENGMNTCAMSPSTSEDFVLTEDQWKGGCVFSVHDSGLADDWINRHYEHYFLITLRANGIGGPVASMLSFDVPALTIYGPASPQLIQVAEDLARLSHFPVIIRPSMEDPTAYFQCHGSSFGDAGAKSEQANSGSGSSSQRSKHPPGGHEPPDEQPEGNGDSRDPPYPDPGPPSNPGTGSRQGDITHDTNIRLSILFDGKDKGCFLELETRVMFFPIPNQKKRLDAATNIYQPSKPNIEANVIRLKIESEHVKVDHVAGALGFLTRDRTFFRFKDFVSLGYDEPSKSYKHGVSTSSATGYNAGVVMKQPMPMPTVGYNNERVKFAKTEAADDKPSPAWVVEPEATNEHWNSTIISHSAQNVNIYQRSLDPAFMQRKIPLDVKYGMSVEVATPFQKSTPKVSFVYRHQVQCWVMTRPMRPRGIIVIAVHYIPDVCVDSSGWIQEHCSVDLGRNGSAGSSSTEVAVPDCENSKSKKMSEGSGFAFATGTAPEEASWLQSLRNLKILPKAQKTEETTIPVHTHALRGWDNTNMEWQKVVWPKLDCTLKPLKEDSTAAWRLDWRVSGKTADATSSLQGTEPLETMIKPDKGKGKEVDRDA